MDVRSFAASPDPIVAEVGLHHPDGTIDWVDGYNRIAAMRLLELREPPPGLIPSRLRLFLTTVKNKLTYPG